ncbi:phage tail spike protein [Clostridium botulinum]|uniref:phage tail spike protein n=1 Tax=Clostridium botulinum TaxID=1491 RepID=UPI00069BFA02|nr:phage tail spike protein [Clostridium botulinum]MCD3203442.1 endopeptidase [Clostridium botulinum C/D]MCD3222305.1 endopeptidase [Clostridium botulinum C/D]MCD3231424.1 endopeptidase [Clostridium botulinum C/D]MCD3273078.1 endopeptidase [Clostridium botulinum C/D]MCD3295351.1 endopeptidase [Clostridium botulinum C/D]
MKEQLKVYVGKSLSDNAVHEKIKVHVKDGFKTRVFVRVKGEVKKPIIVYSKMECKFTSNGLAILDGVLRCEVNEVLNGEYDLELEYPIFHKNIEYLIEGNIIRASTPGGEQPFRIYRVVKNMDTVICYGRHVFYDLQYNFLEDCRNLGVTTNEALQKVLSSTQYKTAFMAVSDIEEKQSAYYIRKNPVEAILTNENSILNLSKAEILRSNFFMFLSKNIGSDNGVTVSYGKNIIGFEEDLDENEVITRVMPTGLTDKDTLVMLNEKYIDSPLISKYVFPKIREVHFSDIKEDVNKGITIETVKEKLKEKAKELFSKDHIDLPRINYRVNFLDLSTTEEYKNFKHLEKLQMGDIVTIKHKHLGIDIKKEVIKYKWDSINYKMLEIELGDLKSNLSKDFSNLKSSIDEVKEETKLIHSNISKADDKIDLLVQQDDKEGNKINAAEIALAIADSKSAIDLIADNIAIKPRSGVIEFPNDTSIDTNNTQGIREGNVIRLKASNESYVMITRDGFSYYASDDGKTTHSIFSVTKDGVWFRGRKL